MYNRVLQFIPQQCQILIDVTHSKSHRLVSVGRVTHSKSHRLVSVGRVPLQGMYNRVLQFIPQQCQILIDVTHSKSHRLVSVGHIPLQGMYNRVLQFIPQQCQILIDVTHSKSHRLVSVDRVLQVYRACTTGCYSLYHSNVRSS